MNAVASSRPNLSEILFDSHVSRLIEASSKSFCVAFGWAYISWAGIRSTPVCGVAVSGLASYSPTQPAATSLRSFGTSSRASVLISRRSQAGGSDALEDLRDDPVGHGVRHPVPAIRLRAHLQRLGLESAFIAPKIGWERVFVFFNSLEIDLVIVDRDAGFQLPTPGECLDMEPPQWAMAQFGSLSSAFSKQATASSWW
jgi:hypothetical protein